MHRQEHHIKSGHIPGFTRSTVPLPIGNTVRRHATIKVHVTLSMVHLCFVETNVLCKRQPCRQHSLLIWGKFRLYKTGLDTNGCPLGNSKLILLSDNLNICLWLSACQVEKIIELAWSCWSTSNNVIGALDNVNNSCGHILQNFVFVGLLSIYTLCYHCYFFFGLGCYFCKWFYVSPGN